MTDQPPQSEYSPAPAPSTAGQGLGITSLVLGILSLSAIIPIIGMVAWILAPLGLIFGFISLGKPAARGFAIGGLITSALGLIICIMWVVGIGAAVNEANKDGSLDAAIAAAQAEQQQQQQATPPTPAPAN